LLKIMAAVRVSSLNHTMPQRLTVASVAYLRSCTSKKMRMLGGSARRSPFGSVRSLLSSSSAFRFSTHSGSTSPSKMIQCRLFISPRTCTPVGRTWRSIFSLTKKKKIQRNSVAAYVVDDPAEDSSEEAVGPLARGRLQRAEELVLCDRLRIEYMRLALHAVHCLRESA
jgi:hypothetical protein